MSGGTWDYQQFRLKDLAEEMRSGRARWSSEDSEPLGLPDARTAVAALMETLADLAYALDWHLAGDTTIENEKAWLLGAGARLRADVDTYFLGSP